MRTNRTNNILRTATRTLAVWLSAGAILGCGASTPAATKPSTAGVPASALQAERRLALRGPDGLRVDVVDLAGNRALVRVHGVQNEVTGKVADYARTAGDRLLSYATEWHGRLRTLLVRTEYGWEMYLPGVRDAIPLEYLEPESAAVDADALQRAHVAQIESGELGALQRFDRAAETAAHDRELATEAERVAKSCGRPLPIAVRWETVTDEQLKGFSVSSYCGVVLDALRNVCTRDAGKHFVTQQIENLRCSLDGDNSARLEGRTLHWAANFGLTNGNERAAEAIQSLPIREGGRSLEKALLDDESFVCSDPERRHVVVGGPRSAPHGGLAYGDGQQLTRIVTPKGLSGGWFLDPRQRNETHNDDVRGYDLRVYSFVTADPGRGVCKIQCGTRKTELPLISGDEKAKVLEGASYTPSAQTHEPVALARDSAGIYYLVDRSIENRREFRLYRGKPRQLRQLPLQSTAIDSGSALFTTSAGSLELLEYERTASWIQGKTTKLVRLEAQKNLSLIYNELGVYSTKRLGVPCDDF